MVCCEQTVTAGPFKAGENSRYPWVFAVIKTATREGDGVKKKLLAVKYKSNSLVTKTIFYIAAIILAVLMAASVILFFWFRHQMMQEYRQLTNAAIANVDLSFDYYITNTKDMMVQWFDSAEGTMCRVKPDYKMVENMSLLITIRNAIENVPYLHSVYFLNKEGRVCFDAGAGTSYTANMEKLLPEKILQEEKGSGAFLWKVPNRFPAKEDIIFLTVYFSEAPLGRKGYNGSAAVNISALQLGESLFSQSSQDNLSIMILDRFGNVVAHSDRQYCGQNWSDKSWVQKIMAEGTSVQEVKEENFYGEISSIPSSQKGFYIAAQTEYLNGTYQINELANVIFIIILAAALLIVALMLPVCRRTFRPLHKMISDIRQKVMLEDKGYDEVQVLNLYYEKLSDNIKLVNYREEKSFIVKNLLVGSQNQVIQSLLLKNHVTSENRGYYAVAAYLCPSGEETLSMQAYDMLKDTISDIYSTALEQAGHCTYFEIGLRRMLFIVSETEEQKLEESAFLQILERTGRSVEELTQNKIAAFLSAKAETGNVSCAGLVKELEERLKTRLILEEYEGIGRPESPKAAVDRDKIIKELLDTVKKGRKEAYEKLLQQMLYNCRDMAYEAFAGTIVDTAEKIIRMRWETTSVNGRSADQREKIKEQFEMLSSRQELLNWLLSLFDEAAVQLEKVNCHSTAAQMEEAVDYIRSNYDDCMLNVNMLADRLNISASYFGKLFREFTGSSALEYITRTRMEKAHDLLLTEPDKDVGRIAVEVGYSNNAYFATAFKKYYGVSPSKLRDYHVVTGAASQ